MVHRVVSTNRCGWVRCRCYVIKMVHSVELSSDAYLVCLTHALSTEKEEVMGLLLGEVR